MPGLSRPSSSGAADPPRAPEATALRSVSVKSLCAFGAKAGDLDFRFAPAPSAQDGIAGHLLVQGRRGESYAPEVTLSSTFAGLKVRGRADGYDPAAGRVEEIKTFRGDFAAVRANHRALAWAQARTYGWMLCEQEGLASIEVVLVYLDIASGEETQLAERRTREDLQAAFEALCGRYMAWAVQEASHRTVLASELEALPFPHDGFRAGQRALAEHVWRAAATGRCLIAQAPTGIGKTLATTFPLLRGWRAQGIDKLFFLTAKTSGRAVALEALGTLARPAPALRVLELTAREKLCEHPGRACHGDDCPLARGFYDRLPAARSDAVGVARLGGDALRELARRHGVCPYFLSQEMVRWSDVVVADYNYWFDSSAFLHALTQQEDWRAAVLVDEAHNLLDRARAMYTAELDAATLEAALALATGALRAPVARVRREHQALQQAQTTPYEARARVPERLQQALQDAVGVLAEHFASAPQAAQGALQRFFFDALQFLRLADSPGDHAVFDSTLATGAAPARLAVRNLVPAPFLQPRFKTASTTVCFSGTIAPFDFYRNMLGLPGSTVELDVDSPFAAQQLQVRIVTDLSTRYRDRARTLRPLVDLMGGQFARQPGNYLAFFSSFEFLEQARQLFSALHPDVAVWWQTAAMRETERDAFVARFQPGGRGIGFAVLGGAFGEGIDLPGDRLIGAFIASLGLPQHDAMNEVMRQQLDTRFGPELGYDYTYLYPGLRKVVQAAGRVIRTEQDAGVLHLIDDRFARPEVRRLLPDWWDVGLCRAADLSGAPAADAVPVQ